MQALADLGIDEGLAREAGIRVYKVAMSWPLEPQGARRFAEGLEEISSSRKNAKSSSTRSRGAV